MSRAAVGSIEPLIAACCRDLQEDAGFLKLSAKPSATSNADPKKRNSNNNNSLANADLFLQPQAIAAETSVSLDAQHKAAANKLLTRLLTSLPQHHLKPTLRGLLDKTAILARNCDAMMASVLNPYKDQRGRMYPSILPHLSQQYPQYQGLEILRSNLRTSTVPSSADMLANATEAEQESEKDDDDDDEDSPDNDQEIREAEGTHLESSKQTLQDILRPTTQQDEAPNGTENASLPIQSNPFEANTPGKHKTADVNATSTGDSPTKRKHEDMGVAPSKRQELAQPPAVAILPEATPPTEKQEDDDDDSDVSVHLNMELDDDEDEDEDI